MKNYIQLIEKATGRSYTAIDTAEANGIQYYILEGCRSPKPIDAFTEKRVYIAFTDTEPVIGGMLQRLERMANGTWESVPYAGIITGVTPFLPGIYMVETVDSLYWIMLEEIPEQGLYYFPVIADKATKNLDIGEEYTVIEAILHDDVLYYRLAGLDGLYKEACFIKKRFFLASTENAPKDNCVLTDFKRYSLASNSWEKVKYGGMATNITCYSTGGVYLVETADTIFLMKVKA